MSFAGCTGLEWDNKAKSIRDIALLEASGYFSNCVVRLVSTSINRNNKDLSVFGFLKKSIICCCFLSLSITEIVENLIREILKWQKTFYQRIINMLIIQALQIKDVNQLKALTLYSNT